MKISVCIATFNGAKYIKDQLLSILKQIGDEDEVIISDDNSTDNTIAIIRHLSDKRISIFSNTTRLGYTRNFEAALNRASGDIIFLSDQDDIWMDDKVKEYKKHFEDYDYVVSDADFVSPDLIRKGVTFFKIRGGGKESFLSNLYKQSHLGCCIAFKREVLLKALPFPKNDLYFTHDLWLCLVGTFYFRVKVIDLPMVFYRRHGENVSDGGVKSKRSLMYKLMYRYYVLKNVLKL